MTNRDSDERGREAGEVMNVHQIGALVGDEALELALEGGVGERVPRDRIPAVEVVDHEPNPHALVVEGEALAGRPPGVGDPGEETVPTILGQLPRSAGGFL